MKNFLAFVLVLVTLTACVKNEDNLIESKKTAVVAILAENKDKPSESGVGTGFFIKDNYIVTNYHVVGDGNYNLKVGMENNDELYEAEIVLGDKDSDVAVIKLKDWEKFKKENPQLTYLKFADKMPDATDTAWAIGHPWGLFYSISKGIISVEGRKSPNPIPTWWIQSDAHIFQGNSGGPLLNEDGDVLGINSVMIAREGGSYGFAIPFPLIKKVINDLEKYKEVRWANLGISVETPGVTIKEVSNNSAANEAGLKPGDRIVSIKTEEIHLTPINQMFDLISFLSVLDYQTKIQIFVERGNELITLNLTPKFKLNNEYKTN
jgi:S1-C subfamily serine protease